MYTFDSRIRYSEVDKDAYLTIESLIDYFQDCSTFQTQDGPATMEYLRKKNIAWVLNSWQIIINRYAPETLAHFQTVRPLRHTTPHTHVTRKPSNIAIHAPDGCRRLNRHTYLRNAYRRNTDRIRIYNRIIHDTHRRNGPIIDSRSDKARAVNTGRRSETRPDAPPGPKTARNRHTVRPSRSIFSSIAIRTNSRKDAQPEAAEAVLYLV